MTGLDDLRATLAARAGTVDSGDDVVRRDALRLRIRQARRRRTAGSLAGVVTAAAVVVAGLAVVGGGGPRSTLPGPAAEVFGQPVPETMTSLGFRYELDRVVRGQGSPSTVEVALGDRPVLVSWATAGRDQAVDVSTSSIPEFPDNGNDFGSASADPAAPAVRYDGADFADSLYLPPAPAIGGSVSFSAPGTAVAVAVYTLDPAAPVPAGVSGHGATFRSDVAGVRLVDATIGEPGEASVSVEVDGPVSGDLEVVGFCTGSDLPDESVIELRPGRQGNGDDGGRTDVCSAAVEPDASWMSSLDPVRPDADGRVTGTATDLRTGRPLGGDVVVGLALYEVDRSLADGPRPDVERLGHRWRLATSDAAPAGAARWSSTVPDLGQPVLAILMVERTDASGWDLEVTQSRRGGLIVSNHRYSAHDEVSGLMQAGEEVGYRTSVGQPAAGDRVVVGYYVQSD